MTFRSITFLLIISWGYVKSNNDLLVETNNGLVQGHILTSYKGRPFIGFEGIPYAKPPIGDLRFKEPEPVENWDGILLANSTYTCGQYIPFAPLIGARGTEDCLYLYIYVPGEKVNPNENYDVVIHIHGGAYMIGSPKMMASPIYMMDQDVIFVTLNYRLNIFGFLSTEDDVVPGNNGMKDQSLALRWIKNNIKMFGGNPDSITLTGLSAGASSVHLHYLSKWSEGLFHRGMSQSGTAFNHWSLSAKPLKNAQIIAQELNCPIDSTREMVECLKKIPQRDLLLSIPSVVMLSVLPYAPFSPVIENTDDGFLTEHPYKLIKEGKFQDLPWVLSNVQDEGILPTGFFVFLKELENIEANWTQIMTPCFDIRDTVEPSRYEEVCMKIKKHYLGDEPVSRNTLPNMVKMHSDRDFFVDTEKAIRLQSNNMKSPVYYYIFSYILEQPFYFNMEKGAAHGDDGKLLTKVLISPSKLSPADTTMMEIMTKFLADYAKTGIPKIGDVEWIPVTPGKKEIDYLKIVSPNDISMDTITELGDQEFWKSLHIEENDELFD